MYFLHVFIVVCHIGPKVTSVEVPLYVTFHFINAYEERDEDGRVMAVIADCCEHNADTTILDKLRLQNLRAFSGEDVLPDARYVPYIPLHITKYTYTNEVYLCFQLRLYLVKNIGYWGVVWSNFIIGLTFKFMLKKFRLLIHRNKSQNYNNMNQKWKSLHIERTKVLIQKIKLYAGDNFFFLVNLFKVLIMIFLKFYIPLF